jgi:hypothetical protein
MPVNDLTDEERRVIKGALRRAFRQSPRMRDVLKDARVELPPALKKDGTPGARPQVRFKCNICGELFPGKWIAVDHINPVVPLDRKEKDMTPNELVDGIFSDKSNLQPLCVTPIKFLPKGQKSCHALKTAEENFVRKGISEKGGSVEEWKSKYKDYVKQKEKEKAEKELKKQQRLQKKKKQQV